MEGSNEMLKNSECDDQISAQPTTIWPMAYEYIDGERQIGANRSFSVDIFHKNGSLLGKHRNGLVNDRLQKLGLIEFDA